MVIVFVFGVITELFRTAMKGRLSDPFVSGDQTSCYARREGDQTSRYAARG